MRLPTNVVVVLSLVTSLAAGAGAQIARPTTCTTDTVRLETTSGVIVGSLVCPAAPTALPVPMVLLLSGSGPTDRDGNSALAPGRNDALRMLADSLAARGIASVRYDKRGVGASRGAARAESELRFDAYVEDAAAWIHQLRDDRRFSTITVVGHSEGSLVGMLATRAAGADGFVSLAGAGRPAGQVLRSQLAAGLPKPLLEEADYVLGILEAGRTTDSLPPGIAQVPPIARLFRPSVQPYLVSWFRYDPAVELARLAVPVLVVQGSTDLQVAPSEASALVRARRDRTRLIVEGMNHVLKLVPADPAAQMRSYQDPSLPVPSQLVDAIVTFIGQVRPR